MSTTLSKGYKKPDTGDRGSSWFKDLEDDIDQLNSHKHDGTDSEKINVKDLVKSSTTILAAAWGADLGASTYKQTITMPTGLVFDDAQLKFVVSGGTSDGYVIFPTVKKASADTYEVYVNDNTLTLNVVYG